MKEQQILTLFRTLDYKNLTNSELSRTLREHGFLYNDSKPYNDAQISSLLHSLRIQLREEFKKKNPPIDRCGIDREHNPCGDASDY